VKKNQYILLFISVFFAAVLMIYMANDSFSISPSDVTDAVERSKEFEGKIDCNNTHSGQMKKEAGKTYREFQEKVMPEAEVWKNRFLYENGRLILRDTPRKETPDADVTKRHFLAEDERIYVFISSSMPKETLKNYASSIDRLKDSRIIMVLRGCIGGCRKLMPTAHFVQSIVAPSEKEQLQVEVQIDPNLFRLHDIGVVPAVVFAGGVRLDVDEGSEGDLNHLQSAPSSYAVFGDASLDYAIEKINVKISNPRLKAIVAELRKGWYDR